MTPRQGLAWALAAATALLIVWLLLPTRTLPALAPPARVRVEPPRVVVPTALRRPGAQAGAFPTPSVEAIALLVARTGRGWVRCPLPPALSEGELEGPFLLHHREQAAVLGVTPREAGTGLLRRDGEPVAGVRWRGARSADQGVCELAPLEDVADDAPDAAALDDLRAALTQLEQDPQLSPQAHALVLAWLRDAAGPSRR